LQTINDSKTRWKVLLQWFSNRNVSREEDGAYCMMGIFGVSMPVLHGEGLKQAKRRWLRRCDKNMMTESSA
jgi:hypothetical protein